MTFRDITRALWQRRRLIEITVVVAVALGLGLVFLAGPSYKAETEVLLHQESTAAPGSDGLLTQQKLNLIVLTYAKQVSSPGFIDEHLKSTGISRNDISVNAANVPNTPIVSIEVTADHSRTAAIASRALAQALRIDIRNSQASLPKELATTTSIIQAPDAKFVSVDPIFAVIVALIAGFVLAATAALILEGE